MKFYGDLVCVAGCLLTAVFAIGVDGSGTEVSAERRLRDFLAASIYPPENRVLDAGEAPLAEVPTVPGDAQGSAVISGFRGEQLNNGSLSVFFSVKVAVPGTYSFRTYLIDAQGVPRLQSLITQSLPAGERRLSFVFYGKAIRDKTSGGRFRLQGILGEKLPGTDGQQGRLAYFSSPYETRSYALREFTDKAWDSPDKRARVKSLKEEIQQERRSSRKQNPR